VIRHPISHRQRQHPRGPRRFLRGNITDDERLVGFEWLERPAAGYGPNETLLVKEYA
jgi:hypothetical protein